MPPESKATIRQPSPCTRKLSRSTPITSRRSLIEGLHMTSLASSVWRSKTTLQRFKLTPKTHTHTTTKASHLTEEVTLTKQSNASLQQLTSSLAKLTFTITEGSPTENSVTLMPLSTITLRLSSLTQTISKPITIGRSAGTRQATCKRQSKITSRPFSCSQPMYKLFTIWAL